MGVLGRLRDGSAAAMDSPLRVPIVVGLVDVGRDLLKACLAYPVCPVDILALCRTHCQALMDLQCAAEELSMQNDADTDAPLGSDADVEAVVREFADALLDRTEPVGVRETHNGHSPESTHEQAHMLLLLPTVLEVCNADGAEVRDMGRALMHHMNLPSFLQSYSAMCTRLVKLQRENERLVEQVERLQVTASLPY